MTAQEIALASLIGLVVIYGMIRYVQMRSRKDPKYPRKSTPLPPLPVEGRNKKQK